MPRSTHSTAALAAPRSRALGAASPLPTVAIGLGSNLQDPELQVRRGIEALEMAPWLGEARASSLYRSPPLGPPGQPDYVNAVVVARSALPAAEILFRLHEIEAAAGRVRLERWGPRVLDLDLLLVGASSVRTPGLQIPHPAMLHRPFVLIPLAEVGGHLRHPVSGRIIASHAAELSAGASLHRILS